MPYTREKPRTAPSADDLRRTIPGWGVDLDPSNRPSYPKEVFEDTGAHWDFPERQQPDGFRERSTEHKFLTPVFGTAQPLRGLSGAIRRYAYKFSEGQTTHWLMLMAGDRVDFLEGRLEAAARPARQPGQRDRRPARARGRRVPHTVRTASGRPETPAAGCGALAGTICRDCRRGVLRHQRVERAARCLKGSGAFMCVGWIPTCSRTSGPFARITIATYWMRPPTFLSASPLLVRRVCALRPSTVICPLLAISR